MFSAWLPRGLFKRHSGWLFSAALAPVLFAGGCESMSNTEKGALAGGGLGAGAGALIGSATHHTGAGAVLGGALGAVAGGLTGNAIDQSEQRQKERLAAATARPALTLDDVIQLTQQHVSDEIIISQVRTSSTIFRLTVDDVLSLKQNGVSDPVIREMQVTVYRYPRRVYVVDPPPPPVSVGVGIGFRGR